MNNDIIFCLLGKTGGVFIESESGFFINPKYSFISESEKDLLNIISEVGYKYLTLNNFVENYNKIFNKKLVSSHFLLNSNDNTEIYRNQENKNNNKNFPQTLNKPNFLPNTYSESHKKLNNEIMSISEFDYSNIKQVENNQNQIENNTNNENLNFINNIEANENLSDFITPISNSIKNFLGKYSKQISEIESNFYNSLSLTVEYIISLISPYNKIFDNLLDFLQLILNSNIKGAELLSLIFKYSINGDEDVKKFFVEIFINCNKNLLNFISSWIINGTLISPEFFILSTNTIINQNTNNNLWDNDKENAYSKYNNNNFDYFIKEFDNSKTELDSWNANYFVEYSNIPSYFPQNLAEDILFIGKALKVLNSRFNTQHENRIPNSHISTFYLTLQNLSEEMFNKNENGIRIINFELAAKIFNLIKSCTSKFLYKLIIHHHKFIEHLEAVKDIFLTFSDEFYFNFLHKIKPLLNLPFNKKIENEINEIHFKNSLKEVFNYDIDKNRKKLYAKFRIKLIDHGINYNFGEKEKTRELINKKEIFLSNFSYYDLINSLRFTSTVYQSLPGAIWNLSPFDVDEEFNFSLVFLVKNFTKAFSNIENNFGEISAAKSNINMNYTENFSQLNSKNKSETEQLKKSISKVSRKQITNSSNKMNCNKDLDNSNNLNENFAWKNLDANFEAPKSARKINKEIQNLSFNVIMHNSKNFQTKNISTTLENLINFFNFEFILKFDNNTNKPSELLFNLKYINRAKKQKFTKKEENAKEKNEEFLLYSKKFIFLDDNNKLTNLTPQNPQMEKSKEGEVVYLPQSFLTNDQLASLNINFKNNYCHIFDDRGNLNFKFHFIINDYFPKEKRKIFLGVLFKSQFADIAVDLKSLNFNVLSGEIYNSNTNLILIDYVPSWPHNFIFNENILKLYNSIFNLLFPIKAYLILLNNLWIEKKNYSKRDGYLLGSLDSLHAELMAFLQNYLSFLLDDIIDVKYKYFTSKCGTNSDLEMIIKYHEEFLGDVISCSFIKSKKIMNLFFDILYTIKMFCDFSDNMLTEMNMLIMQNRLNEGNSNDENEEFEEFNGRLRYNVNRFKSEFREKFMGLIDIFGKIKNSKYHTVISQLMIKLNYNNDYYYNGK